MNIAPSFLTPKVQRHFPLLFSQFIIALLLASLFLPFTASLWQKIDIGVFKALNLPLENSPVFRNFWALANHRMADWLEDLFFVALFLVAIFSRKKQDRKKLTAELIFAALLTALTIILFNRLLCRDLLKLRRASPSLVIDQAILLSDYLSSITFKIVSSKSFPGDHATTALLFTSCYAYFVRGKLGILALLYGVFLCLPRLAVGAHWFSDIIVGSGCIALFSLSWALFTPFASKCVKTIEKGLSLIPFFRKVKVE
ncbi:MAG: Lipid A 1-diphosphate synthase [Chlamydiae bacterium]|nr:Lipid A 1-diphosphate synthase [Chlamydiota bacterium]